MAFGGMRFGGALLALGLWLTSAPTHADEPSERILEVRSDVELMLMEGRTNEVDAIADGYRASRVRISGGWWALAQLYEQLTPLRRLRLRLRRAGEFKGDIRPQARGARGVAGA
jgi:hypothetical protein